MSKATGQDLRADRDWLLSDRASPSATKMEAIAVLVCLPIFVFGVSATIAHGQERPGFPRANDSLILDSLGDPLPRGAVGRLGTERFRHSAAINGLAFTPDNKVLASGSADRTVRLWNAANGKELHQLGGSRTWIYDIALSTDGKRVAAATAPVTVWDVASGQSIFRVPQDGATYGVAFSPDGTLLATADGEGSYRLWRLDTGTLVRTLREERVFIPSVAFSPDGKLLATTARTADLEGIVSLWDVESGKLIRRLTGHKEYVSSIDFAPDGRMLVSAGVDHLILQWDVETGEKVQSFDGHEKHVLAVKFAPDGKTLASAAGDDTARIWDVVTGQQLQCFRQGSSGNVNALAFTSDGERLAVGSNECRIRLWDLKSGQEVPRQPSHQGEVGAVAFAPDGKRLVSASYNGLWESSVRIWDVESRQQLRQLRDGERISSVAFAPDGKTVAAGADRNLYLYDADTGRQIFGIAGQARQVAFVGLTDVLASDRWHTTGLWNIETGKQRHSIERPAQAVAPDGTAATAIHRKVQLWSPETGQVLQTIEVPIPDTPDQKDPRTGLSLARELDVRSFAFSSDSRTLALSVRAILTNGADGRGSIGRTYAETIHIWNALTGKEIQRIALPVSDKSAQRPIDCLAFAPDGQTLAGGGRVGNAGDVADALVLFWDVASGAEVHRIPIPRVIDVGAVKCLAYAPDGQTIATGGTDSTVLIWKSPAP